MNKPDAWTADDIRREYDDAYLRELEAELVAAPQPLALGWTEPGEVIKPREVELSVPPNVYPKNLKGGRWISKFSHLRANRCPERLKKRPPSPWPTHLAPWQEELLVLWWRT